MSKSEKIVNGLIWCLAVCLGGYLIARGFLRIRENPPQKIQEILRQAYSEVEEEALSCYLPACFYEEGQSGRWLENTWNKIWNEIPILTYLQQTQEEQTVIEDESTCHEIIEVNGKTITDRLLSENQAKAVEEENQAKTVKDGKTVGENEEDQKIEGSVVQSESDTGSVQVQSGQEQTSQADEGMPAWTVAVETSPVKDLSMEKLSDYNYLLNNFFVVDPNTTVDSSQINVESFMGDNLQLSGDSDGPQILIYHTHSQEGYVDSVEGDENTSVVGVGNYLESILRDIYGYQVIHMKNAFDMADGQLERSKAYNYALPAVQQVLDENPSIEVVIDLHRDGVPEDKHLVTEINGKQTAQIMYFNGLSRTVSNGDLESLPNPYISDNLAFAFQLSYQAAKYYPRFTRCIYLKGYRYNLHVRPRSILLEVGAQTNTVEEAMNAMEPFSVILNKVLKGE